MMWYYIFVLLIYFISFSNGLPTDTLHLSKDYFSYKNVKHLCYLSCGNQKEIIELMKTFMAEGIRVCVKSIKNIDEIDAESALLYANTSLGVLLDGSCNNTHYVLDMSSRATLMGSLHMWLVVNIEGDDSDAFIDDHFQHLNLSVDADIIVAHTSGDHYKLQDIFNFGRIQGNNLEKNLLGTWRCDNGLNILLEGFKYYRRWDFHNLTLRAVSVILNNKTEFKPSLLEDVRYTPGVSAMTKVATQLLSLLKEQHNFRLNYTIVDRWIGLAEKNSTLSVANSLFWREQDVSATCLRMFPKWLDWMEPFLPAVSHLETKVYYMIPEKGVGEYENRFLSPLSTGVWACTVAVTAACLLVLSAAASTESRRQPAAYALFSIVAAVCQQGYDDGDQLPVDSYSSQSRNLTLLVVGMLSMLLFNYYTSSVVSWLLSAAPPSIVSIDALIRSGLQLTFEDKGFTRSWLGNPGQFYFNVYKNPKEDELRDKMVVNARRTVAVIQSVEDGIELVRTGAFAYHTEPYDASQVIGRRFTKEELCKLGALQMMSPAPVYIQGQPRSPYKKFFVWRLLRLLETGHVQVSGARVGGEVPPCSGQVPRALALGQAAPAFAVLAQLCLLATIILSFEIVHHRMRMRRKVGIHAKKAISTHITHKRRARGHKKTINERLFDEA